MTLSVRLPVETHVHLHPTLLQYPYLAESRVRRIQQEISLFRCNHGRYQQAQAPPSGDPLIPEVLARGRRRQLVPPAWERRERSLMHGVVRNFDDKPQAISWVRLGRVYTQFQHREGFGRCAIQDRDTFAIPTPTVATRAFARQPVRKICADEPIGLQTGRPCPMAPSSARTISSPSTVASSFRGTAPPNASLGSLSHCTA
jgi:hypothetical protein